MCKCGQCPCFSVWPVKQLHVVTILRLAPWLQHTGNESAIGPPLLLVLTRVKGALATIERPSCTNTPRSSPELLGIRPSRNVVAIRQTSSRHLPRTIPQIPRHNCRQQHLLGRCLSHLTVGTFQDGTASRLQDYNVRTTVRSFALHEKCRAVTQISVTNASFITDSCTPRTPPDALDALETKSSPLVHAPTLR